MADIPFPIDADISLEQPLNDLGPTLVTLSGIVIDISPEQPENASFPMFVTLSGIVIDVSPMQS